MLLGGIVLAAVAPVGAAAPVQVRPGAARAVASDSPFPSSFPGLLDDSSVPSFPSGVPASVVARWDAAALSARADRISQLATQVSGAGNLSVPAQTTLQDLLAADAAGVATLEAEASASGDLGTLEAVASSMVLSYRVVSVVSPLVADSIDASNQLARATSIQSGEAALEAAITTGLGSGGAVGAAQSAYRDLVSQIGPVAGNDGTQLTALLAIKPASYQQSVSTIGDAETALADGWSRVHAAVADERKIIRLLAAPGITSNHRILRLLRGLLS